MISKVFIAYILIALSTIPTSSVTAASDAEVPGTLTHPPTGNATLAPVDQTAAHPATPANSTASANISAAAGHPPANATSAPTGNSTLAPVGQTAAHPATPANSTASANISAATGHPTANATSVPRNGNLTDTVQKEPTGNATLAPVSSTASANTSAAAGHPPVNATSVPKSGNLTDIAKKEIKTNETSATPPAPRPHVESPPTTTCFHKSKSHGIENHHCDKALDKVVFSTNQTLDKFSSLVFVNYKTCNIHVQKPQNGTLTKIDLSLMVHNLTADCHSVGGMRSQSSKVTVRIERGTKENIHDVDIPVCKKQECPLTQSDCLSAFYQLPTNAKGVFVNGKGKEPFARATSGNCTVTASTTDLSAFMMPRQFVLPTMKKLINQCGEHPGKIYLSGGTKGYNGDIWLSARAANKDLCH
ncbi:hypothetical protein PTTG_05665 [Puccinia triticina 1-1 BBBD Race 1]|uniref:Phosphatidylglycerol/phosphatidylinositol transfer protein n=2 Tax=Puccinia triticina TaxID=208348 RepID=A0A180GB27_PUCT1|nr:uncharacterized protein PtA15_4A419 [Puccinia triticina]OAV89885.1 hypothetical protein PTTG_05665 [Puccinia triticina 1-1 BBBD Race 1]WAQ83968.1 hypothetical protein PtA15_4A419 [Puccinia triticina]WAR54814.1 hypothetical protein PtB15_4B432 [Puccinia triticina]